MFTEKNKRLLLLSLGLTLVACPTPPEENKTQPAWCGGPPPSGGGAGPGGPLQRAALA